MTNIKNSKAGFTLAELVVTVAILTILAAIAIPVVSNTINSSKVSCAVDDAKTAEIALKESYAMLLVGNYSLYTDKYETTVEDVFEKKGLTNIKGEITVKGKTYVLTWYAPSNECRYINGNTDIQQNNIDDSWSSKGFQLITDNSDGTKTFSDEKVLNIFNLSYQKSQ